MEQRLMLINLFCDFTDDDCIMSIASHLNIVNSKYWLPIEIWGIIAEYIGFSEWTENIAKVINKFNLNRIKKDWRNLKYVKKQTPEICLAAVQQDGWALGYVDSFLIYFEKVDQKGRVPRLARFAKRGTLRGPLRATS